MKENQEQVPQIGRLQYKAGDLIIKEGDYGISIYKIVTGKVRVFTESRGIEVNLAVLGPGEVIGEMSFLSGAGERRSASARALEDADLEVWHPSRLSQEYVRMPAIIKYIANQALGRLIRMNRVLTRLSSERQRGEEETGKVEPRESQRLYYRKEINEQCTYGPVSSAPNARLPGKIKNISFTGMGLIIGAKNALKFSHELGNEFRINTLLPNGKELDVTAKIITVRRDETPGMLFMGLSFTDMTEEARKNLGFFLLP